MLQYELIAFVKNRSHRSVGYLLGILVLFFVSLSLPIHASMRVN